MKSSERILLEIKFKRKVSSIGSLKREHCIALSYKVTRSEKWRKKIESKEFIDNLTDKEISSLISVTIKKKKKPYTIKKKRRKKIAKKKPKPKTSEWKEKYRKYLASDEWAEIKLDLFNVRGKKCERCGHTENLQVHHLSYENVFKEEYEDLEILCAGCHMKEHNLIKDKPSAAS